MGPDHTSSDESQLNQHHSIEAIESTVIPVREWELGDDLSSLLHNPHGALRLQEGRLRLLRRLHDNGHSGLQERTLCIIEPGDMLSVALLLETAPDEIISDYRLTVASPTAHVAELAWPIADVDESNLSNLELTRYKLQRALQNAANINNLNASDRASQGVDAASFNPVLRSEAVPPLSAASAASALNALKRYLAHYKRPPMTHPPKASTLQTLDNLADILDRHGLGIQIDNQPWKKVLTLDCPFILESEPGVFCWVNARQGKTLLVEAGESAGNGVKAVPFKPAKGEGNRTFNTLHAFSSAVPLQSGINQNFGLLWYVRLLMQKSLLSTQMILASVFVQIFALGMPIFYMVIFDRVFGRQNLATLDIMGLGIAMVLVVDVLVKQMRAYVLAHQLETIDKATIDALLHKLFELPLGKIGPAMSRNFTERYNELTKMNQSVTSMLLVTSMDVLFSLIVVAFLLLLHPMMGTISLASLVPIVISAFWSSPRVKARALANAQDQRVCQLKLGEALQNAETIKSLSADRLLDWKLSQLMDEAQEKNFGSRLDRVGSGQIMGFFAGLGAIVTLYFGAHAVLQNEISYGVYMAINMMSRNVVGSVQRFMQAIVQFQEATDTFAQFRTLLGEEGETQRQGQGLHLESVQGRLSAKDVYFRYQPEGRWVLDGLSVDIEPGQKVVLAGRSGAGKTTFIRLLQRLYDPTSGYLCLDGLNTREFDLGSLRQHISVALQRPALFSGSVRENIMLGNPTASNRELLEAIAMADLEEFLLRLPKGLDGEIQPMGANLSGGQAAGLALARVFLREPDILVLDEALTHLEPAAVARIFDRILEKYRQKTCLFVSDVAAIHQRADRILVLHEGQLVEDGTYDELMRLQGYYYHLQPERMHSAIGTPAVAKTYSSVSKPPSPAPVAEIRR